MLNYQVYEQLMPKPIADGDHTANFVKCYVVQAATAEAALKVAKTRSYPRNPVIGEVLQ